MGPSPEQAQIIPSFMRDQLNLTADQKNSNWMRFKKKVDGKLQKLLTDDQKQQLKQMREARSGWSTTAALMRSNFFHNGPSRSNRRSVRSIG